VIWAVDRLLSWTLHFPTISENASLCGRYVNGNELNFSISQEDEEIHHSFNENGNVLTSGHVDVF